MPGRLLAAVLQGEQAEVGQVGDRLARCVDAEDAAGLARLAGEVSSSGSSELESGRSGSWLTGPSVSHRDAVPGTAPTGPDWPNQGCSQLSHQRPASAPSPGASTRS